MYPVLFRIGEFEVTSFGVMVALAALVGLWLFRRELRRSGLPLDATNAGLLGVDRHYVLARSDAFLHPEEGSVGHDGSLPL